METLAPLIRSIDHGNNLGPQTLSNPDFQKVIKKSWEERLRDFKQRYPLHPLLDDGFLKVISSGEGVVALIEREEAKRELRGANSQIAA